MNSIPVKTPAMLLLFLCCLVGTSRANDNWSVHPEWSGDWKFTPEISKLLGFPDPDNDSIPLPSLQIGFFVSKEAAIAVLGIEKVQSATKLIEKMGHKVVAAGYHKETTDPNIDSACFVTTKAGSTYVWLGDQSNVANFAKVHFVRGLNPARDILVLDFGGIFKQRLRGISTKNIVKAFGYRRQAKKPSER